jgi:hypothetical protein
MTHRERLPNRRLSQVHSFVHDGQKYHGSVSYFIDGEGPRAAEVFLDASKPGSAMQAIARDAAVTASLALQHGTPIGTLRDALTRDDDGQPAGPLGRLLDMVADTTTDQEGTTP